MKIRTSFVSNSSSSAFLIAIKAKKSAKDLNLTSLEYKILTSILSRKEEFFGILCFCAAEGKGHDDDFYFYDGLDDFFQKLSKEEKQQLLFTNKKALFENEGLIGNDNIDLLDCCFLDIFKNIINKIPRKMKIDFSTGG